MDKAKSKGRRKPLAKLCIEGFCGMKRRKKSGGGDVRATPFRVRAEKSDGKQAPPSVIFSSHMVGRCAPHSHPHRPKKKSLREKKVGFAEKKTRLTMTKTKTKTKTIFDGENISPFPSWRGWG